MGVRLARVGALGDGDRLDAVADHRRRHVAQVAEEPVEPGLEPQAVPQDQIGVRCGEDVRRGRLEVVHLGPDRNQRGDVGGVAGDVGGHVGDDGEGGHHLQLLGRAGGCDAEGERQGERVGWGETQRQSSSIGYGR